MGVHCTFWPARGGLRFFRRLVAMALITTLMAPLVWTASASTLDTATVRVPGHVLLALQNATPISSAPSGEPPLTLTVVLRREDEAGFSRFLAEVQDPRSPSYRRFLTQRQLADRFGPSQKTYDAMLSWLQSQGLTVVQGSANRLTMTVNGTRQQVERAFALRIRDYKLGARTFYANDTDPAFPRELALRVVAVSGLSSLAEPKAPLKTTTPQDVKDRCRDDLLGLIPAYGAFQAYLDQAQGGPQDPGDQINDLLSIVAFMSAVLNKLLGFLVYIQVPYAIGDCAGFYLGYLGNHPNNFFLHAPIRNAPLTAQPVTPAIPVNAQKIGLLEFDSFHASDVRDWLTLLGADPTFADRVSAVPVNGGAGGPGAGEPEVLLDIAAAMLADPSPHTQFVVYHAPASTSFQQVFNAMINDGVTVISNSWSECEDQHTFADVQSIDSVLAQAAASGISVFNGSGDSGSTCLDGGPNTVGVPASSPHATAVGGTTPTFGPGFTYQGETWWNGSGEVPPTGQGGFGVSRFFARPVYQNGLTASATRSIPDVAIVADPRAGLGICQADAGGCPTGLLYGGTSMAAPLMAGMVAFLNEALGSNVGELNSVIYPLAGTDAFHSAASMSSDFAHVGLGSPIFHKVLAALSHYQVGSVDASKSRAGGTLFPTADGTTPAIVRVNLVDANNFPVTGKLVSLTPNAGSHAIVSAASGPSDDTDGAVTFAITDTVPETVTFTVTDVTDGLVLTTQPKLTFVAPPATSGGITASPSPVASDGASPTTITVTLQDAQGHGSPGKLVTLSQGGGHSIITGPTPAVTDANGQIQFTATNNVTETVVYTAVDVTDGNLPVPGSASVTFTGGSTSCVGAPPTAAPGFTLTPFANGFVAKNFFFGNINFIGCPGATNPAFDTNGSVFVADFPNGNVYKFGVGGGAVSNANILSSLGPTFGNLVFGKDGSLYGSHFSPSNIVQVDPTTGAVVRTLASGFPCPSNLVVDPLSGDLFFNDNCTGGGSDNPSVWRIHDPSGASPTVTVYASLPATPGGGMAFSPDGTLYAIANSFTSTTQPIVQISGTDTPSPPTVTTLSGITSDDGTIAIGAVQPSGAAKSLLIHTGGSLKLVDLTTNPFTTTTLATGTIGAGVIGPDGCLYANAHDTILKLSPSSGVCGFTPTNPSATLALSPVSVSPDPAQGTSATFTATLRNVTAPEGTPIRFLVSGANTVVKIVRADSNGQATFTYTGVNVGADTVAAGASVDSTALISNLAHLSWVAGKHVTFLTLNPGPTGGTLGQRVTVKASLVDISADPPSVIPNADVSFTLGTRSCAAVTDGNGIASCDVTPDATGLSTLTATFAGTAQYVGSTASTAFTTSKCSPGRRGGEEGRRAKRSCLEHRGGGRR